MQNVLEIVSWYKKNLRQLPWRETKDPYRIWLSEIILQQTQVVQGLQYYHRFLSEYPDIQSLAQAEEQAVLKLWQGLGYYSRARNLHKTARIIVDVYGGKFPQTEKELLSLPGIGGYTAAAILSFAYLKPYPALDGNVYRVLSRLFDIHLPVNEAGSRPVFMEILESLIQGVNPSDFNNAMMELGAVVCKPDQPDCGKCPVAAYCIARQNGTVQTLPLKKAKPPKKQRYFNFVCLRYRNQIYLQKRSEADIWRNMFQLPLLESDKLLSEGDLRHLLKSMLNSDQVYSFGNQKDYRHLLSHQEIFARFTELVFTSEPQLTVPEIIKTDLEDAANYPMPVLIEKFLLSL